MKKSIRFVSSKFPSIDSSKSQKEKWVNFRDCQIKGDLEFWGELPELLFLSGCSYKRIRYKNLESLIIAIKKAEKNQYQGTFDRRSWIQLESALRTEGRIDDAETVYVQRRKKERTGLTGLFEAFDWAIDSLTGYGTNNKWMGISSCTTVILFALIFFIFGTFKTKDEKETYYYFINSQQGQVLLNKCDKDDEDDIPQCLNLHKDSRIYSSTVNKINEFTKPAIEFIAPEMDYIRPIFRFTEIAIDALAISLHQFLPFKVPSVEEYEPADDLTVFLAGIEKLLGWIFIPLLIANLSGLLHNKAEPQTNPGENE